MKIEQTFLCLNCDEIFGEGCGQCPTCASTYFVPLAKFLPPLKYNRILIRTLPVRKAQLEYHTIRLSGKSDLE